MTKLFHIPALVLFVSFLFAFSAPVMARNVSYEVKKQDLNDVVDTLSDLSGIAVIKAGGLRGSMENWRIRAEGIAVFEALARDAGLFMAFDGSKVILASHVDVKTTVLPAGDYDWPTMQSMARSLFPIMPADALHYEAKTNMIVVRAPSSVTETIASIATRPSNGVVRIIKGGNVEDINLRPSR